MASGASSSAAGSFMASPIGLPISEKLNKTNLVLWKAQVMPVIRGAQLEGLLDVTVEPPPKEVDVKQGDKDIKAPNPDYGRWVAQDQQALSYLLTNMLREVMAQVTTARHPPSFGRRLMKSSHHRPELDL